MSSVEMRLEGRLHAYGVVKVVELDNTTDLQ